MTKVLVVYDVSVKTPEVLHVPLIINYGMFLHVGKELGTDYFSRFAQSRRRIRAPVSNLGYQCDLFS
jgi:hypothetical protein